MSKNRYVWLDGMKIPVTEEVYRAYYRPVWREAKQKEVRKDAECSLDTLQDDPVPPPPARSGSGGGLRYGCFSSAMLFRVNHRSNPSGCHRHLSNSHCCTTPSDCHKRLSNNRCHMSRFGCRNVSYIFIKSVMP